MAREQSQTRDAMFETEHWLAWLMAATALVLGAIGILRGFGIIGTAGVDVPGADAEGTAVTAQIAGSFLDGLVWLLPAIAAAGLAAALHINEHHRSASPDMLERRESGLFKLEHGLSWLMGLITIAAGVLAILVGFDLLGLNNTQQDGILWGLFAIMYSLVTLTLHYVRGHQTVTDEDYLVRLVEERVGGTPGTARPVGGAERAPR